MKRLLALFLLCSSLAAFVSCANTDEGYEPEVGDTVIEEPELFLFSPDPAVQLTAEEESEIILAYAAQNNDPAPEVNEYTVRCYGASITEEHGRVYAVVIEKPNYDPISFDEYFESPYDYPVTREYKSDAYDVWSDMRAPLLIYKNGEFFPWRNSPVDADFLAEVLDTYLRCNEDFYNAMNTWSPRIETDAP